MPPIRFYSLVSESSELKPAAFYVSLTSPKIALHVFFSAFYDPRAGVTLVTGADDDVALWS